MRCDKHGLTCAPDGKCVVCRREGEPATALSMAPRAPRPRLVGSDNARQNRSVNPRGSIPTFDVEGDVMVGFSAGDLVAMIERAAQRHAWQN